MELSKSAGRISSVSTPYVSNLSTTLQETLGHLPRQAISLLFSDRQINGAFYGLGFGLGT